MSSQLVLALDVGGSSVKSALVEAGPRVVGDVTENPIHSKGSATEILNTLAMIITGHLQNCRGVRGIAIAFPGPFDYEQGICLMQNQDKYDALYGLNVSTHLKELLEMPNLEIRYRNDAEAAILGEAIYGAGTPFSRLLGLTLGTGLGSAFVANGKLIMEDADVPNHGWLYSLPYGAERADDAFSTRGLLTRFEERGIHVADIASAIDTVDEDPTTLAEVFISFGTDLGIFLKPFVSAFRAEAVLVTGGIAEVSDRFVPSMMRALSVPVIRGKLGRRAALFGAAALYC